MTTLTSHEDTSAWFSTRLRALEPDVDGVEVTAVQRATCGVSRETWMVDALVTGGASHLAARVRGPP